MAAFAEAVCQPTEKCIQTDPTKLKAPGSAKEKTPKNPNLLAIRSQVNAGVGHL